MPAPQAAAQEHLHGQGHLRQGATLAGQHHADAWQHHPHAQVPSGEGGGLPGRADLRQEALARRRQLAHRRVVLGAVVPDGRGVHQHRGTVAAGAEALDEILGGSNTAFEERLLPLGAPAPVGDALAREVEHGIRSLQCLGQSIPALGPGSSRQDRRTWVPRDDHHLGALGQQRLHQGPPHQARAPGHHHTVQGLFGHGGLPVPWGSIGPAGSLSWATKAERADRPARLP